MKLPLQITFRHMDPSPALEARIRELASRFDRFSAHIMRCHIVVEPPAHHKQKGFLYDFRIDITLPDGEIAIRHAHPANHAHEDPYVALRDAFRAARRQLEDYERKHRHDVKTHTESAHGWIHELDAEHDSGRIQTDDGRLIYFHRNSILGGRFQDLTTGTEVRFAEEAGDLGPQASTVHVIT
ncbi:MAG: HPF/RaiA family ribosome-associated protein [Gammaproteobacteria bacterium]|nr:HPF/RaiA family ribosome-associated protein [Gammaproteobacteria bacterium]MDE2261632.1 HPF/RaiA family ribosome-associated protein [Gammaproteobacteria bacterium]